MQGATMRDEQAVRDGGGSTAYQRPWPWLLSRDRISGLEVFTQQTPEGATIVPVFSSAEAALAYLSDGRLSWKPRKTGRGELASILMGICREARWVVLDPPSPGMAVGKASEPLYVLRESFLEALLGRGRSWFERERERRRTGRPARSLGPHVMEEATVEARKVF